jgi:hypothetical protein
MVACSPKIAIVHRDPTHESIVVRIDNEKESIVDYGDDVTRRVSRGRHFVTAHPEGGTRCPWTKDGKGWTLWVDTGAVLTLLPPPPSTSDVPQSPHSEDRTNMKELHE